MSSSTSSPYFVRQALQPNWELTGSASPAVSLKNLLVSAPNSGLQTCTSTLGFHESAGNSALGPQAHTAGIYP